MIYHDGYLRTQFTVGGGGGKGWESQGELYSPSICVRSAH